MPLCQRIYKTSLTYNFASNYFAPICVYFKEHHWFFILACCKFFHEQTTQRLQYNYVVVIYNHCMYVICICTRHAPSKYAKTHLRTSMSRELLKSRGGELSNGIWHAYIEQYRSVIYRCKGLWEHFSLKIGKFAYLSNFLRACLHDAHMQILM